MKRVKVKITKCVASPNLNGLIIDDMSVDLISNKKPRMTIEDLANIVVNLTVEVREGFRNVNSEITEIKVRLDKQDERMNKHWGIE